MSKVSKSSENLINQLLITEIKCNFAEKESFLIIATNLILLNTVELIPVWKSFLKLAWRILSTLLWGVLILVILSSLGRSFAFGSISPSEVNSVVSSKNSTAISQDDKFKLEIDDALEAARTEALSIASVKLDNWIDSLIDRVDSDQDRDFLDWYFGYWTQQKFGLNGALQAGKRIFDKNIPTAKEKIQEEVLQEFTSRVLRPEIAKLELKNISKDISNTYTNELQRNFEKIRVKHNIPKANWNDYLKSVTVTITDTQGRQVPLQLKAFTIASLGGGVLLSKAAVVAIEKVTAKVATKVVSKAGASFLSKAGALVGGELLGPVVTVAIIAWDAIDIHNTAVNYRPVLKQNIEDYFTQMKEDILGDEDNGIQKVVLDLESNIRKGINFSRVPFLFKG